MGRGDDESTDSSGDEEEQEVQGGGGFMVRAVRSQGEGGYHRRGKVQLAKIAESKAARTVTIPEWNGDMFLWGEFAAKFNAFRAAVKAQVGGARAQIFG